MKQRILKANAYYRVIKPNTIIFYKLKEGYAVFGEDALKVGALLNLKCKELYGLASVCIDHPVFYDKVEILGCCGKAYCAISYIDDNGALSIPDVDRLEMERKMDI